MLPRIESIKILIKANLLKYNQTADYFSPLKWGDAEVSIPLDGAAEKLKPI